MPEEATWFTHPRRWNTSSYGLNMKEKSRKVGRWQRITIFQVNIQCGLPYLNMQPFTDREWDKLPHVTITHEADWYREVLDNKILDEQDWYDSLPVMPLLFPLFDEQGSLWSNIEAQQHNVQDLPTKGEEAMPPVLMVEDADNITFGISDRPSTIIYDINESTNRCVYFANLDRMVPFKEPEISVKSFGDDDMLGAGMKVKKARFVMPSLCLQFAWLPAHIVQKTFGGTMQYVHMPYNTVLHPHYKAPNPALNHFFTRRNSCYIYHCLRHSRNQWQWDLRSNICWYQVPPFRCLQYENTSKLLQHPHG